MITAVLEEDEAVALRKAAERETMMLMRDFRGRCVGGMDSQVRRPMSTALIGLRSSLLAVLRGEVVGVRLEAVVGGEAGWEVLVGGAGRFVMRAKKARSAFRGGQGRVPRRPMPREGVVATMRVRGGRSGIDGEGGGEGVMVGY